MPAINFSRQPILKANHCPSSSTGVTVHDIFTLKWEFQSFFNILLAYMIL